MSVRIQRSQSSFMHRAISRKISQIELQHVYYLFQIRLDIHTNIQNDDIDIMQKRNGNVEIFDPMGMIKMRGVTIDTLKHYLRSSNNKDCTTIVYKINGKYYIPMNWRNILFFGDICVVYSKYTESYADFLEIFDKYRWNYIRSLLDSESVSDKILYEKVGSNSHVSDIDISISPKVDFSERGGFVSLSACAIQVKEAFMNIMTEHAKYFHMSFEDLFDTNVYATNFTFQTLSKYEKEARQIFSDPFFHIMKKKVQKESRTYYIPRIDISTYHEKDIRIFSLSQTVFAFRRLFNFFLFYRGTHSDLCPNITYIQNTLNYNTKKLIKDILPKPKYIKYYVYSKINDLTLLRDYTEQVVTFYSIIEQMLSLKDSIAPYMTSALNSLCTATLMEMDSYHSFGAFIDIVTLSGKTYIEKSTFMIECMRIHSILDNLGFIVDILYRHSDDYCYDIVTRILKTSKYIERICNNIPMKNEHIARIYTSSVLANAARKEGTYEKKLGACIICYNDITKQNISQVHDIQISYFTECILKSFDVYIDLTLLGFDAHVSK